MRVRVRAWRRLQSVSLRMQTRTRAQTRQCCDVFLDNHRTPDLRAVVHECAAAIDGDIINDLVRRRNAAAVQAHRAAMRACHDELLSMAASGVISPLIGDRMPLAGVPEGLTQLAAGTTVGRVAFLP